MDRSLKGQTDRHRATIAICGWVADRTSERSVSFYTGLIVLGAATVLFGFAKASWVLLISRLLQGLSAAITYTVGLALLVDTVGRDNIGQWMGTALSSSSFGLIVSPLLGGIVYAKAGYMSVFAMALALIVFDIGMRLVMIEKKKAAQYKPLDALTPENGFYGTFTHERSPVHEPSNGSTQPRKPQDDSQAPLLPNEPQKTATGQSKMPVILILLGIPRLLAAIYGIFVNVSILTAFDGVLPLYVKKLFGWNSLEAGLIFLCLAIPALTGPIVGQLSDKVGPRWIAVAGCSLTAPPLVLLRLVDHDSMEQKILLCALLVCCGQSLSISIANTRRAVTILYSPSSFGCTFALCCPVPLQNWKTLCSFTYQKWTYRLHTHPDRLAGCCRPLSHCGGKRKGGPECLRPRGCLCSSFCAIQLLYGSSYTLWTSSCRCDCRASWLGRIDCGDGSFRVLWRYSCCKYSSEWLVQTLSALKMVMGIC